MAGGMAQDANQGPRGAANAEIEKARRRAQESEKAVRALRHALNPLYNSLRALWGEMEAIPDSGAPISANPNPGASENEELEKETSGKTR